ncbi:DMT family transporter [Paracoccaceae bacterium]|nr:DMT family transporter [Paracoccaceae bacterium]
MSSKTPEVLGHGAMLLFSLCVSVSYILGALVANDIEPGAITAARFLIGAILMGTLLFSSQKLKKEDFKKPWRFFVLGISIVIYFVLMFEALKTASSLSLSVVFTLTPLIALFFEYFLKKRVTLKAFLAIFLGAMGAIWVIFDGNLNYLLTFKIGYGEILFFWGCVGHALYAILIPILNKGENAASQTLGTLSAGFLVLILIFTNDVLDTNWLSLSPLIWITIVYLATIATAFTFFLIQFAAKRISASKVMAYTYAVPFWVALGEIVINSRFPNFNIIFGGLIIAFALLMLISDNTKAKI